MGCNDGATCKDTHKFPMITEFGYCGGYSNRYRIGYGNEYAHGKKFRSSICIRLLLFHNNQNNVYYHSFPVSLVIVEIRAAKASKRGQKVRWIFHQKTPTHYRWTTKISASTKYSHSGIIICFLSIICSGSWQYRINQESAEKLLNR